jgi:heme A synthase
MLGALAGVVLVSMAGAVTALGDTLYPVLDAGDVGERLAADHGGTAHFLQRMRVVHPVFAVLVGLYLLWLSSAIPAPPKLAAIVAGLVVAQLCAGVINIMLSAPGWMQLVHLALGTSLWVGLVLLGLESIRGAQRSQ